MEKELTPSEVLVRVFNTLYPEPQWIQGREARDIDGNEVSALSPDACQFCLEGALINQCSGIYSWTEHNVYGCVFQAILDIEGLSGDLYNYMGPSDVQTFNDKATHNQVLDVVLRAIWYAGKLEEKYDLSYWAPANAVLALAAGESDD